MDTVTLTLPVGVLVMEAVLLPVRVLVALRVALLVDEAVAVCIGEEG